MRAFTLASALTLAVSAAFPQADDWQRLMDQGIAAHTAGDYGEAASCYRAAAALSEHFDRANSRRFAAWNALATAYDALGRYADAETNYRRALGAAEQAQGKSSVSYASVLANLGTLYAETGQAARAVKTLRQALAIHESAALVSERRIALTRSSLGDVLAFTGKYGEAANHLTTALAALEKLPDNWSEIAVTLNGLAVTRMFQADYADSERLLRRALATLEQHAGSDHPMLVRPLNDLASVLAREHRMDETAALLRRAIDIAGRRIGIEHRLYGKLLANYAGYLRQAGEKSQAKTFQAQADRILQDSARRNGLGVRVDISTLRAR